MNETLHIVVSCTDRKRLAVPEARRLRAVRARGLDARLADWWARLQAPGEAVRAADLYAGDHWRVALGLPAVAGSHGYRTSLWVASAGYGLIHSDAKVRAYGATFSARHPDSVYSPVVSQPATPSDWWAGLARYPAPGDPRPRRLSDLGSEDPAATLLVLASADYLKAMHGDLLEARAALSDPARLLVVTRPGALAGALAGNVVPSEARLRALVKGALPSLHSRVARRILAEADRHPLRADVLADRWRRLAESQPPLEVYGRTPMTDDEIRGWIRKALAGRRRVTKSGLLRALRDEGRACEQKRFGRLYAEVREARDAA